MFVDFANFIRFLLKCVLFSVTKHIHTGFLVRFFYTLLICFVFFHLLDL